MSLELDKCCVTSSLAAICDRSENNLSIRGQSRNILIKDAHANPNLSIVKSIPFCVRVVSSRHKRICLPSNTSAEYIKRFPTHFHNTWIPASTYVEQHDKGSTLLDSQLLLLGRGYEIFQQYLLFLKLEFHCSRHVLRYMRR
jgi:hypothetical protein